MKNKLDKITIVRWILAIIALVVIGWTWYAYIKGVYTVTNVTDTVVAMGTALLAYATFQLGQTTKEENAKLLTENKRIAEENLKIREQERELDSKRRRLDEVKRWAEGVASLSVWGSALGATGHVADKERADKLSTLLSDREYIKLEARLLDVDLEKHNMITKFDSRAEKVVETTSQTLSNWLAKGIWGDDPSREEVKKQCLVLLQIVSSLRAELVL